MKLERAIQVAGILIAIGFLLMSCAPTERMSGYTFRDMDDGTSILLYVTCGSCSPSASLVINWETRTVCETLTKDVECWVSVEGRAIDD